MQRYTKLADMLIKLRTQVSKILDKAKELDFETLYDYYEQWKESKEQEQEQEQEQDQVVVLIPAEVEAPAPNPKWWWSIFYQEIKSAIPTFLHVPAKTDLKRYQISYRSLSREKPQVNITEDAIHIGIYGSDSAWENLTGTLTGLTDRGEISETNLAAAILEANTGIPSILPSTETKTTACLVIQNQCIYFSEGFGDTKAICVDESESITELTLNNNAHTQILQASRGIILHFLEPDVPDQDQGLPNISTFPKTTKLMISSKEKILIFGSRMFWEYMTHNEAVNFLSDIKYGAAQKLIEEAVSEALRRGELAENNIEQIGDVEMTVVVVTLPPM